MGNFQEIEDNKLVSGIFMYYLCIASECSLGLPNCHVFHTLLSCSPDAMTKHKSNFYSFGVLVFCFRQQVLKLVKKFAKIHFSFIASDEWFLNDL